MDLFPNDDACLDHMMRTRWGERFNCSKCGKEAHYYRVKKRRCYECEHCGHQVYPTAGTPFAKSRTSLRDWFYVMYLFCASRNGVAAKEVERQLGVTYKTAWRMCNLIRRYRGYVDGDRPLGGRGQPMVEIDKAFIGGRDRKGKDDKSVVLGMAERHGGEVLTRVVLDKSSLSVMPVIMQWVRPGARISTDEAKAFGDLGYAGRFDHQRIKHAAKEWVRGDAHTNTLEAFWANVKRSIRGTYIAVSSKYL
jgi:transposase-like protein